MFGRYLPTPKPVKKGGVEMFCPVCKNSGYYRFGDVVRHPGWCPGRPPVAAAGVGAEERRVVVALEQPRQGDDRALLRAAERDRRAVERDQALRGLRDLAAEQQRRLIPIAVLELRTASASGNGKATASPAATSTSTSAFSPSTSASRKTAADSSARTRGAPRATGGAGPASCGEGGGLERLRMKEDATASTPATSPSFSSSEHDSTSSSSEEDSGSSR